MNQENINVKFVQKPTPLSGRDNMGADADRNFQLLHETITLLQKEINDLRSRVYALENP